MENFYKVVVLMICIVLIRKLISSFDKKQEGNQEVIDPNHSKKQNEFSAVHLNDNDFTTKETEIYDEKSVNSIITSKNSFLYPDDDFGTMTKGKVYNSIVYDYEVDDNDSKDKMKIIRSRKKKNSSK